MSASRSGSLRLLPTVCLMLGIAGCNGVFWGNLGVLCVTVAIFLGTVFLTRSGNRSATRATASTSQRSVSSPRSASTSQQS
jgi:hypothetical protein